MLRMKGWIKVGFRAKGPSGEKSPKFVMEFFPFRVRRRHLLIFPKIWSGMMENLPEKGM